VFVNLTSLRSFVPVLVATSLVFSSFANADAKIFKIKSKPVDDVQVSEEVSVPEADNAAAPKKQATKSDFFKKVEKLKKESASPKEPKKSAMVVESAKGAFDEYGISVEEKTFPKSSGDVPVHVLRVNLNAGKVVPKIVLAEGRLGSKATLTKICKNFGAVAAINGSFFDAKTYAAVGYLMIDGKPIQAPLIVKARTTFGIMSDGSVMVGKPKFRRRIRPEGEFFSMIDGINRKCSGGEIIIYTEEFGKSVTIPEGGLGFTFNGEGLVTGIVKGKANIPETGGLLLVTSNHVHRFKNTAEGTKIHFTQTLMSPWDKARDAFGSGMLLVSEGKVSFDQTREEVGKYLMGSASRTAVGITADNHLVMVVADGRGGSYKGVDFDEIAQIMVDCGCTDAIALDGGGSSTMVYNGEVLNTPSDKGGERKIANALVLIPAGAAK